MPSADWLACVVLGHHRYHPDFSVVSIALDAAVLYHIIVQRFCDFQQYFKTKLSISTTCRCTILMCHSFAPPPVATAREEHSNSHK